MEHSGGPAWLAALEHSPLGQAMRESIWLYPTVEIVHILGFVLLVGPIVAFDFRLLGLARDIPLDRLGRLLIRTSVTGFCLTAPAGLLLFATEATAVAANPAFFVKLGFIAAGLANAGLFRLVARRQERAWPPALPTAWGRFAGAVSLAAWTGAIVCGRLLAYF
jgi:hypothetical protein